jgi:hypothetical protein
VSRDLDTRDMFAFIVIILIVFVCGFYAGRLSVTEYVRALDEQMRQPSRLP